MDSLEALVGLSFEAFRVVQICGGSRADFPEDAFREVTESRTTQFLSSKGAAAKTGVRPEVDIIL